MQALCRLTGHWTLVRVANSRLSPLLVQWYISRMRNATVAFVLFGYFLQSWASIPHQHDCMSAAEVQEHNARPHLHLSLTHSHGHTCHTHVVSAPPGVISQPSPSRARLLESEQRLDVACQHTCDALYAATSIVLCRAEARDILTRVALSLRTCWTADNRGIETPREKPLAATVHGPPRTEHDVGRFLLFCSLLV